MLRFFNSTSTYDLTTQQVLAHSWLHGYAAPISLGPTNYLLKIFLIYMPADLLPGSPRLKLILLTILINVATYILLFIVLQKILAEFKIEVSSAFYSAMLWLSIVAGSVFWIEFANSRNLEVAGGMFLVLYSLRVLREPTKRNTVGLTLLATLLFFADTLQVYMVALPILVYALLLALFKKTSWKRITTIFVIFSCGVIAALILTFIARHVLDITISKAGAGTVPQDVSQISRAAQAAIRSTVRQLSGGIDAGKPREVVNLLFIVLGVISFTLGILRRKVALRFGLFVVIFLIVDELVYIFSGTALQSDTSRYLVMLAPVIVLALASLSYLFEQSIVPKLVVIGFILFNAFLLSHALIQSWDTSFPKDRHLGSVMRYLNNHNYAYAFSSMDSATPLAYYGGVKHTLLLPVACGGGKLVHAYAFRDTHIAVDSNPSKLVPVILDGQAIINAPSVCTEQPIVNQLGKPATTETTDDGSSVLLFSSTRLLGLK